MHYTQTEVHNSVLGEDQIWYNLKIWDLTPAERDTIMIAVSNIYENTLASEAAEYKEWKFKKGEL